ncbi:hypothetical protein Tco_1363244 [Tanacetum coccineum]
MANQEQNPPQQEQPFVAAKQVDYVKIIWEDLIHKLNKKTREKIVPYLRFLSLLLEHMMPEYENEELTINPTQVFSVYNLTLRPNQPKEPPFTTHMKAICNLDVPVDSNALKPSSQTKKDKSPSHSSPPTLVVGEMHKETQQATGDPTSLGATSKERAHPQLSSGSNPSVLVDKTKSARDGLKTARIDSCANKESRADDISLKVKLEDLSDILKDTRSAFFTPDSPTDETIIVSNKSEKEEFTYFSLRRKSWKKQKQKLKRKLPQLKLSPHIQTSTNLLNFCCLPTELKELLSKITGLFREIKELKKYVRDMEIELPGDLKEIQTKLETSTSTISIQEKLKTLDSLPSLLHKVTDTLNRLATMVDNASRARSINVPSAGKATTSPANGEKNTKDADTNLKDELVNLLGKNVMTHYYIKKLLFDKYCNKMLKRKKSPKITNCEVLTKKGPITLKIYREDGSDQVISNLKVSDLHSAE